MKNIKNILILVTLIGSSACTDFIEPEPSLIESPTVVKAETFVRDTSHWLYDYPNGTLLYRCNLSVKLSSTVEWEQAVLVWTDADQTARRMMNLSAQDTLSFNKNTLRYLQNPEFSVVGLDVGSADFQFTYRKDGKTAQLRYKRHCRK